MPAWRRCRTSPSAWLVLRQLEYISAEDVVELKVSLGPAPVQSFLASQLVISLPNPSPQILPCLHAVVVRLA